jgi:hypothetical protein
MPDTIRTEFVGGPCDGQTKNLTTAQLRAGAVSCGGSNYIIQGVRPDLYRATWAKQVAQEEKIAPPGGHAQFDTAWLRLMRSLAFTIPANTKRVRAASQRIRSAVR